MDKCPDKTYNDNGVCKPCHQSCKDTCNGPEDTIGINGCNACKNLKDGVYCTKECPTHKFEDKGECKFCHENCLEECTGSGPDSCITNACNYGSYEDGNGECKLCHENCYGSCTGPNSIIGLGGCKACKNKTLPAKKIGFSTKKLSFFMAVLKTPLLKFNLLTPAK